MLMTLNKIAVIDRLSGPRGTPHLEELMKCYNVRALLCTLPFSDMHGSLEIPDTTAIITNPHVPSRAVTATRMIVKILLQSYCALSARRRSRAELRACKPVASLLGSGH